MKKPVSCSWWKCSFGSDYHDMDKEVAELGEFAVVSVNAIRNPIGRKNPQGSN